MFDWNEIVLIGVVALIVIGPKELPAVLRAIGQWTTKIRRMAGEFQSQFQEAMREAEMADLKKQVDEIGDAVKVVSSDFNPLEIKEADKWEPQPEPKPDAALVTTPESPAAPPSDT
jgi:sec-independent protein translocase protein TatB